MNSRRPSLKKAKKGGIQSFAGKNQPEFSLFGENTSSGRRLVRWRTSLVDGSMYCNNTQHFERM